MTDVVVTLPRSFRRNGLAGLAAWYDEGDQPGTEWSGTEYFWSVPSRPRIEPGERVYVVHRARLIGYAPLIRVEPIGDRRFALVRGGGAVAMTIDQAIRCTQGYRYRWWDRAMEVSL